MTLLSDIFKSFGDAYEIQKAIAKERQKPRRITSIHTEEDGINVSFHTGEHEIIPYDDYCVWFNDVSKNRLFFRKLRPEELTDLNIDHEEILLYLRWELGYFGVYLPIEE